MLRKSANTNATGLDPKWWVLVSVGIGTFMSALDGSIVNTILPVIQEAFGCEVATVQWVVTIYLLVVSGLLLSFGRAGDLYGHKTVYAWGFVLFIASSALCGLAPSVGALIVFRGFQALGAGMLFASAPAILTKNFPARQRGQALGLQGTMTYLGLASGPSLGGWLADQLGWRSVFLINIPVGLLALAACLAFVPRDVPETQRERFDIPGAAVFLAGLVALLLGLNQGHAWGWTSVPVLALLAAAAGLLGGFVFLERRVEQPMLDLALFRQRPFSTTVAAAVLNYICMATIAFLMPFYLIQGRGLSPGQAGLLLTVQPLVMALAAPLGGLFADRVSARLPAVVGMTILALGAWWMAQLEAHTPFSIVVAAMAVTGLGTGIFIAPNNSTMMGSAPRNRQGIAGGILATARNVGMVLGVGLAGAVITTVLAGRVAASIVEAVPTGFQVAAAAALAAALVSASSRSAGIR